MKATRTNRRQFLKAIALGAAGFALPKSPSFARRAFGRPNILFIMADDHAANAINCYGSRLRNVAKTPNIDRIAAEGARLLNCFCTNSICVPSRATILTGQYSHVNGVYTLADKLDPERQNVAKLLQAGGYQTAIIGKWHLKTDPTGFDHWNILPGQGRYHNPVLRQEPPKAETPEKDDKPQSDIPKETEPNQVSDPNQPEDPNGPGELIPLVPPPIPNPAAEPNQPDDPNVPTDPNSIIPFTDPNSPSDPNQIVDP
ncbi:MAG: sulfatase-like hydrolase/transferase, partial [Planctomycetota bacterium]